MSDTLDACQALFLRELIEGGDEGIRIIVGAGEAPTETVSLEIAGTILPDCRIVESNAASPLWEIRWSQSVAYSVRNESFTTWDDSEFFTGHRFRLYSKSHFLDYVARATIATSEYPGPMQHIGIVCENHIIDVVSVVKPEITRLR